MVEMLYTYGWDDAAWTVDDKPQRFRTQKAAAAEILEHVQDCTKAGLKYSVSEYRVVPAP